MNKIETDQRSKPYYNEYHYAVQFTLWHASCLRVLKHDVIDQRIQTQNFYANNRTWARKVEPTHAKALHEMCDILLGFKENYKRVTCSHHMYLYTNCLEDLKAIAASPDIMQFRITHADVCLPKDVVLLKNPKRKYRTYFKDKWVAESQTPVLRKFLLNRTDCYEFTPLFKSRLEQWDKFYTMSHFFIDHDDPKDLLMLELVVPGLIRKTMPIQAK